MLFTGVSYRNYSPSERTALVTVFYNPQETSVRQVVQVARDVAAWMRPGCVLTDLASTKVQAAM